MTLLPRLNAQNSPKTGLEPVFGRRHQIAATTARDSGHDLPRPETRHSGNSVASTVRSAPPLWRAIDNYGYTIIIFPGLVIVN